MTQTALRRLLKYPHAAVFDESPASELAFRLQHPDHATWEVGDRQMTVRAGALEVTYDLRLFTVDTLITQLISDGFTIVSPSSFFTGMSARVLVDGSGDERVSNGDHIYGFTSLLWVLLNGYAGEVLDAEYQVQQALLQMVITTASGQWLDLWGTIYGVPRLPGESDAHFAPRIPKEAFRLRNNAHAIELAIRDATGFDVRIEEPWKEIFKLDQSLLSGPDRLYDGDTIGYHLIRPVAHGYVDWPSVFAVIDRNRAAGVMVIGPRVTHSSHSELGDVQVTAGIESLHTRYIRVEDRVLLDYMNIEDVSVLNHQSLHRREILHSSYLKVPCQTWGAFTWGSAGTWSDSDFVATIFHNRDYRVHYQNVRYTSNFWPVGNRTWSSSSPRTWASDVFIDSLHTRS